MRTEQLRRPNAQIYGEVRDSKTGALIQQDINGTKIMYEELGFENPDRQQMIFKVSGEYRNNLMFAAKYDIYFEESNFVIPDRLEGYEIKRGENRLDFEVQPYIRISNASIRKEGSEIRGDFYRDAHRGQQRARRRAFRPYRLHRRGQLCACPRYAECERIIQGYGACLYAADGRFAVQGRTGLLLPCRRRG